MRHGEMHQLYIQDSVIEYPTNTQSQIEAVRTHISALQSASYCSSVILSHGVVTPSGQVGTFVFCGLFDGPTPSLEESSQVHPHSLGESLGVQVHLSFVVSGEVAHCEVGSKHLLKGIPAKLILELHARRKV